MWWILVMSSALAQGRCAPSPWFTASAEIDGTGLPEGVTVTSGSAPSAQNVGATPLVLFREEVVSRTLADVPWSGPSTRYPIDKLASGKAWHYFETGIPVEGMQSLTGWQNPYDVAAAHLPVIAPIPSMGPGRPADLTPPDPVPFELVVYYGPSELTLRGAWHFTISPTYDPEQCLAD